METPTSNTTLDHMSHIPIAELSPSLAAPESRALKAIVTLTWPFSSATGCLAFLLSEPDFRLRRQRGQVRVQFAGSSARRVAKSKIASGDEVLLCLDGVEWIQDENKVATPGKSVEFELRFSERLLLKFRQEDSQDSTVIDVDHPPPESELPVASILPDAVPEFAPLPAGSTNGYVTPRGAQNEVEGEYASPAFLKRARTSYGSLFELDPFLEDGVVAGKGRKRTRLSAAWAYSSRSPTPEREASAEPKLPETPRNVIRPMMTDEGCQTVEMELGDAAEALTTFSRQAINVGSISYNGSIIQTEEILGLQPVPAGNAMQPPAIKTQLLEDDPQSTNALDAMPRSPRLEPLSSDMLPLVSPLINRDPTFSNTNFDFDQTPSRQNPSMLDDHSMETVQEDLYSASPQKSLNAALPTSFARPFPPAFGVNGSNPLDAETLDHSKTQLLGHSQSPHTMNESSSGSQGKGNEEFQTNNDTDYGEHGLPIPLDLTPRQSRYPELDEGDHSASINQWGSRDVSYPGLAGSSIVEDDTLLHSRLSRARESSRSQSVRSQSQSQIVDLTDESGGEQEAVQYEQQGSAAPSTNIARYLPSRRTEPPSGSQDHHEYDDELDPQNYDEEDEVGYEGEENRDLQSDPRSRHYQEHEQDVDDDEEEPEEGDEYDGDGYEMDENGDLYAKPHLQHGSDMEYEEDEEENMHGGYEEEEGSYEEDESEDAASLSGPKQPPEVIDLLSSDEDEDPAPAPVAMGADARPGFHIDVPHSSCKEDSDSGDSSSEESEDLEPEADSNEGGTDDERDLPPQAPNQLDVSDQSMRDGEGIASGAEEETAVRHGQIREESIDSKSSLEDHNSEYRNASQSPRSSNIAVAIPSSPPVGDDGSNHEAFIDRESNQGMEDNKNEEVSHGSPESSSSPQSEAEMNIVGNSGASFDMEDGAEEEMGTPKVDVGDQIDSGDSAETQPQISATKVTIVEKVETFVDASYGAATEAEPPYGISSEDQMEGVEHHTPVQEEMDTQEVRLEPGNSSENGSSSWNPKDFASRLNKPYGIDGAMDESILDSPPLSQLFHKEMNIQLPTPDDTQATHQMLSTETSLVTVMESQNFATEMLQVSTETYTNEAQRASTDIGLENAGPVAIQAPIAETAEGNEADLLADLESSLTNNRHIDAEIAEAVEMVEDDSRLDIVADKPTEDVIPGEEEQQTISVVEKEDFHVTEDFPVSAPNDLPVEGQDVGAESGTAISIDDLIQQDLAESEIEVQPTEVTPVIVSPRRSQRHVKSASTDGQEQDANVSQGSGTRDASSKDANVTTEQASSNLKPDVQQEAATVTRRSRRHKGAPIETLEEPSLEHQDASNEKDVIQDPTLSTTRPESEANLEAAAASIPKREKKGKKGPPPLEGPTEIEPKIDETTIKSPRRSHRRTRSTASNSKENANPNKVSKAQKDLSSSPSQATISVVIDNQGTPKGHDASVELAISSFESPSKHYDLRHPLSHLTPVADLKIRLLRNLRTDLSEFTSLKMIPYHLKNKLDVLAIITSSTPEPQRSKGGPRHYHISFHITDPSIAPNDVTEVQVFRPYKEALPIAQVGDAILLRNFTPVSVEGGFALHSDQSEASSWAVFKADKMGAEAEMRGPPVEYGSGETTHIETLIKWFKNYDQKALAKFAKAAEKGKEAERRKSAEPTKPTRKLRSAD